MVCVFKCTAVDSARKQRRKGRNWFWVTKAAKEAEVEKYMWRECRGSCLARKVGH